MLTELYLQCLEEEFQNQLEEQERHYGHYLVSALASERNRTPSRSVHRVFSVLRVYRV